MIPSTVTTLNVGECIIIQCPDTWLKIFLLGGGLTDIGPGRSDAWKMRCFTVLASNDAFNRHAVKVMTQLMSDNCVCESFGPPPVSIAHMGSEKIYEQRIY